jgi:recombination protein RecA
MQRAKISRARIADAGDGGLYFDPSPASIELIPSGCTGLDCVLAGGKQRGGYRRRRIANIVGDKSTDKTGLCIEAATNFLRENPKGWVRYNETEAAFDQFYAARLGMPLDRVQFVEDCITVEEVFDDLTETIKKSKQPGMYILDSLDAVTSKSEAEGDIEKGSYGTDKAKKMSQLFRRLTRQLSNKDITVIIVSQIRDKIGVKFGETKTRSGGKALDFYASQVVWLASLGQIKRTINKVERVIGVWIRARCKKNKVAPPFRDFDFPVLFDFGVDDVTANVEWLQAVKMWDGDPRAASRYLRQMAALPAKKYRLEAERLAARVRKVWLEIEKNFEPARRKYE